MNLIFFVVFFMLLGIIFLNLLIATILMLTVQSLNLYKSATRRYKLNNFLDLWKKYDEDGEGYINYKIFFQFSMLMAMEYGIDKVKYLFILVSISLNIKKKIIYEYFKYSSVLKYIYKIILLFNL